MVNIGEKIAVLRKQRQITQEQLAKQLGISRPTLSHYETNRRKPPIEIIVLLADKLKISIDTIIQAKYDPRK